MGDLYMKAPITEYGKLLEKLSTHGPSPRWTVGEEKRFRTVASGGGHLAPGQYRTYRSFVDKEREEYSPDCVAHTAPKFSLPITNKDSPGGLMTALGKSASAPDMGPGRYPAEKYLTMSGKKSNILSTTQRQPVFKFGKEPKFFVPVGSNSYKQILGPGYYEIKHGFKIGPEAQKAVSRAQKEMERMPGKKTWASKEFSKMYMCDARRGEDRGFPKQGGTSKEQRKEIESMVCGNK